MCTNTYVSQHPGMREPIVRRSFLRHRHFIKTGALLIVPLFFLFAACGTTKTEPETDPNFLGDFDPVRLEDVMALRKSFGKIKPTAIRLYFVPRTNIVEAHLRDGMNTFALMFDENARNTIGKAAVLYAAAYNAYANGDVAAMPVRKPTRKTAFKTGTLSLAWGVASTARNGSTDFRTDYEFLEKDKPYFLLTVEPADDKDDSSVQSPVLNLYFSPSQLETLLDITRQEVLQTQVDELNRKAFTF